ncbi:MAG: TonB-dependent receptor [Flavobacterium sp.]|nr:MAG: TonB-dependent receptor [Flavobacterium sp.]
MNKIVYLFLFFCAFSYSQNVRIEGMVRDTLGLPLEMANVMAVNKATNAMDSYAITNEQGRFQLLLKANTAYIIKASYIGFTPFEKSITTGTENTVENIELLQGVELEGIEIVHEMPVTIKGDTIVYNSDSFTNGSERKLEDILKKLPGVEVNADGEIEVEGKKVSKLMVEGKDFFDGDTKLGVKNIPADAVSKVEVLRNYNEIDQLRGVQNNNDNLAMNIKLKEGKKNFWFGDVTAGASIGEGERYIVNPKIFYYNPKFSVNLIGNFNNTGELPLTMQDYFKFTGGFRSMMSKSGTSFNVGSNDLGISMARNNRAKEIETKFGAANFSYNPLPTWTVSGFAIINSNRTEMETVTRNVLLDPITGEPETIQDTEETSDQKNEFALFKLSSSYKRNKDLQFDYDMLMKTSNQEEFNALLSTVTPETSQSQDIYTTKKQKPFSFNQNMNLYYTLDDKNIFSLEVQHLYQDEDPLYNANLANNPFPDIPGVPSLSLGLEPATRFDISQERFVKTNKVDAKLDYYYMVTAKSSINVTLGNTYSYQNFNSSIFQTLDNDEENSLNDNTKNHVDYAFNDVFVGLHYRFIKGKFELNPGVSLHNYNVFNDQLGSRVEQNFIRVLPDVFAQLQLKKMERITYNYSMSTDFTDVSDFARGLVLNNYKSLFQGNRNLRNGLYQNHTLGYFKYNMFNFTQIYGGLTYSYRMDAIKNLSAFNGINQVSTVDNSDFADETISGSAGYNRSFAKYYKASANVSMSWNKFNNFRFDETGAIGSEISIENSIRQLTEQFTQRYSGSFATNFKDIPNLELGYTLLLNDYADNKFYTHTPFAKMDYYFLDAFTITADYSYNHYYNDEKTVDNEFDFLNANIMYRQPDSKWEFKVGGTNLFNTGSLNDDSFNQFSTRTSRYTVQPRYLLLSIRYNL